jgi:uncharacterized membrane protein
LIRFPDQSSYNLKTETFLEIMMKAIAPLSLLLSLAGWALIALTAMNLLSGHLDDRSCQTDCVQGYFFAAVGVGIAALIAGLVSLLKPGKKIMGYLALALSLPLCLIFAGLYVIGHL